MSHLTKGGKTCAYPDGHRGKHRSVCCVKPDCFLPRHRYNTGRWDSYCWPHRQETNQKSMAKYMSHQGECGTAGCKRPRSPLPGGKFDTRCTVHQTVHQVRQRGYRAEDKWQKIAGSKAA